MGTEPGGSPEHQQVWTQNQEKEKTKDFHVFWTASPMCCENLLSNSGEAASWWPSSLLNTHQSPQEEEYISEVNIESVVMTDSKDPP